MSEYVPKGRVLTVYWLSIFSVSTFYGLYYWSNGFVAWSGYMELCIENFSMKETVQHWSIQQDDPRLITYIKQRVLQPPDKKPYNLTNPDLKKFSADNIEDILDIIFKKKKYGTFFEAGAYTGESVSNTLYLERELSWTGLLVEGSSQNFEAIKTKHRKAWLASVCLSPSFHPQKVPFIEAGPQGWIEGYFRDYRDGAEKFLRCSDTDIASFKNSNSSEDSKKSFLDLLKSLGIKGCDTMKTKDTTLQCFPLYSLLLASGFTSINFMSLDIQGAEMAVLQTIPFDKVNIEVLLIEVNLPGRKKHVMIDFMKQRGYRKLSRVGDFDLNSQFVMDFLFIKDELQIPIL